MKLTLKTGTIVGAGMVRSEDSVALINSKGIIIRIPASQINRLGRSTQGVTLMRFDEGDSVVAMTIHSPRASDDPLVLDDELPIIIGNPPV